jgi:hypothetical protein
MGSSDALDIGCFRRKLEQQLSKPAAASELEDALYLAATLTNTAAASVASTAVLSSDCFIRSKAGIQLGVEAVQQLMQTAIARSLHDLLLFAARQPAAQQVPAAAMLTMIKTALHNTVVQLNTVEGSRACQTLHVLCEAAALDDAAALALLEATTQLLQQCRKEPYALRIVMSNAAVNGLGPSQIEQVMLQALQPNNSSKCAVDASHIPCTLVTLPGARQLSAASLQVLLKAALPYGSMHVICSLVRLPAMKQLSAAAVADVLQLAARTLNRAAGSVVGAMVQPATVPAAAELNSDALVQLVEAAAAVPEGAAAEREIHSSFRLLLQLPCLQQADAQQLRQVVLAARKIYCGRACAPRSDVEPVMKSLLEAPAVGQLPADAIAALLVLSSRYYSQLREVIALSSAAEMTQQQLQPILLSAMQQLCKQATEVSLYGWNWRDNLAAARPESNDAVKLFHLPAAGRLDTAAVAELLAAAAEYNAEASDFAAERHRQAVEHVCRLPAAQSIGQQQLSEMIQGITSSEQKRGNSAVAAALCQLPAAVSLSRDVVHGCASSVQLARS